MILTVRELTSWPVESSGWQQVEGEEEQGELVWLRREQGEGHRQWVPGQQLQEPIGTTSHIHTLAVQTCIYKYNVFKILLDKWYQVSLECTDLAWPCIEEEKYAQILVEPHPSSWTPCDIVT